jgi:hypothetical protein
MEMQPQAVAVSESTFPRQAARASILAPIVAAIAGNFVRTQSPIVADLITIVLVVAGLGLAVIALVGMSRAGKKGVLVPAAIGLILNLALVSVFLKNFAAAYSRARHGV